MEKNCNILYFIFTNYFCLMLFPSSFHTKKGFSMTNFYSSLRPWHLKLLKSIALNGPSSRVQLARENGLSKMTVSNYVSDLIRLKWLEEDEMPVLSSRSKGRRPTLLKLSPRSPRICGILIMRGFCQAITTDLSGNISDMINHPFSPLPDSKTLITIVSSLIRQLTKSHTQDFIGCGIACVGPLNTTTGTILSPPNFGGIKNLNIVEQISDLTGLHTILINDASAGALAEKLYGIGKTYSDFASLHFTDGIGMGFVINDKFFDGFSGQCGEIGHVSIKFDGPLCDCGNHGCLELYANEAVMNQKIHSLKPYYPASPLFSSTENHLNDIITAASRKDAVALAALDEFLTYISYGLISTINLLDFSAIITDYYCDCESTLVEDILLSKIRPHLINSGKPLHIIRSGFAGTASLIGSCGIIVKDFFDGI